MPSAETVIASPLKETGDKRRTLLKQYRDIIEKMKNALDDEKFVEKVMSKYPKGEFPIQSRIEYMSQLLRFSYEDYTKAISLTSSGYNVVFRRDIDEAYINPYNIEWIRAWNGNMDLQVCLDFHAVITYITDYYSKDDSGTMEVIKKMMEKDNSGTQDKMQKIAQCFLTHRMIGEAEAVYRLIPSMNLQHSNITCQWVSLGPKDQRTSRWKFASEEIIKSGIPVIQLKNHEGYWYEQQDFWSKYLRRPSELKEMCYAQFAKMYRSATKRSNSEPEEQEDIVEAIADSVSETNDDKFHTIITFRTLEVSGTPLPKTIELQNPYPGEAVHMTKRTFPASLRFQKVRQANNPDEYMFNEVMLYCPTIEEFSSELVPSLFEEEHNGIRKVQIVKSQVMEFLEDVEEARYFAEMHHSEEDYENIGSTLDPQQTQENADCNDIGEEVPYEYEHLNTDLVQTYNDGPKNLFKRIDIPDDNILKANTRNLDKFQREVLNVVIKFCKDVVKARRPGNKHPEPPMLMVHGGAGAGKSTVINIVAQWAQKILRKVGDSLDEPCVVKTAFCGTAASNIDGQTLHSTFGFSFSNAFYSLSDKQRDEKRTILKNLRLVIIDEISMVKVDMLYQLDLRLQEVKEQIGVPFGGVAILAFGDLCQLKPCQGKYIFGKPSNEEFQLLWSKTKTNRWLMFTPIILEINHRQGRDKPYSDLLNRMRVDQSTEEDFNILHSRVRRRNHPDLNDISMYITGIRKQGHEVNSKYISKLKGEMIKIPAIHFHPARKEFKGKIEKKDNTVGDTGFDNELCLKMGARVMLIHNLSTVDSLTNGQLGTLEQILKNKEGKVDKLVIKFQNPSSGAANREKFSKLASRFPGCTFIERVSIQYTLRTVRQEVSSTATVIQFPIKAAFALTAHKVQGQSIPYPLKVAMDIDSVFADAQAYVMLSRVQCLEQVYIVDQLTERKIRANHDALTELKRLDDKSINRNPTVWNKTEHQGVRIASLNVAGLASHILDVNSDDKIKKADVLLLQETSLDRNCDTTNFAVEGFTESNFIQISNGRGIASFVKVNTLGRETIEESDMQMEKLSLEKVDIIQVYRSSNGNKQKFIEKLTKIMNDRKITVILGDFNICAITEARDTVIEFLIRRGFKSLMMEPTQIMGRCIDHCYISKNAEVAEIERYSPYYSDHDSIFVTL